MIDPIKVPAVAGSSFSQQWGLVAVLDALGAASYSRDKSEEFLRSRDVVLQAVTLIAGESLKRFDPARLKRFVFNDTAVLAYLVEDPSIESLKDAETFCHVLRAFEMLSLAKGILFRGALSIGELYKVSEQEGTILGPAVSDAAAWYGLADWIGINATPHATMWFEALREHARRDIDHVLVDYEVPLKDKGKMRLKAINWPKDSTSPDFRRLYPEGRRERSS